MPHDLTEADSADIVNRLASRRGVALSRSEARTLARPDGSTLLGLMSAATRVRATRGNAVGHSRKVFIPLTRLCRNRCGYCSFSRRPVNADACYMTPEMVLDLARAGAAAGCKEALFCLGERPEARYPAARAALGRLGYPSTVAYVVATCDLVRRETGLLPHVNCGTAAEDELAALSEVMVSGGLMLESTSDRLGMPGGPHDGCPGKRPEGRLETIEAAGRQRIAFTTGILIGIGETPEERVDALFAIKECQARHGHIQEVIVQNFQPHPGTPMAGHPVPGVLEVLRTLALARLILGPDMNLQAPPNLAQDAHALYLLAGANDWGGVSPVTADMINPASPWPAIAALRQTTADAGFLLRERLPIYPEFIWRPGFLRPQFRATVDRWVDASGYVPEEG